MDEKLYESYLAILKQELVPALGCTEPIALAYGAATAREVFGGLPEHMDIFCSGNIIKNVKSVTVPNSGGMRGIEAAAVLGAVGGCAEKKLEVLEGVTALHREKARELLARDFCTCHLEEGVENLYIRVEMRGGGHLVKVVLCEKHTRIDHVEKDGEVLSSASEEETPGKKADIRRLLNVRDILTFADEVRMEDIEEVIGRQVEMNTAVSDEGLKNPYGAQVGRTLLAVYGDDVKVRAKARAAAGSDARMNGCSLPVIINSGSGNQGITCSLPVIEFAREWKASKEKMYRALTVSNLVAIHQKKYIGSLSAYCGAVSAGCGAGAGVCYLYGGGCDEISHTLVNALAIDSGIVCDGAKSSCAAKIASAVEAGLLGMEMSRGGSRFHGGDGILEEDVENTILNVGDLARNGMRETDEEIIRLMIKNA